MMRSRLKGMQFDGDVIITDPSYVIKYGDWRKSKYGTKMERIGLHKCITVATRFGDWEFTTFVTETEDIIGHFYVDSSMIGAFDLAEVLEYCPDFTYHTKPYMTTLIKDFKGKIYIEETRTADGIYIRIIGEGINKITGKKLNFHTEHTGL